MTYHIDYSTYLDRVYGCWLGKCIAGTIGAPFEGAKELMNLQFDPAVLENMLPNDDLDLQVLWLAVLEEKGVRFTTNDLAEAFYTRCPYAPGEYATFKRNWARGIHPPASGWFNNGYYRDGMGCPIRSEIWACIAPANPALAARLAAMDGIMDHAEHSVHAEQFLAALESAAFVESDMRQLVQVGLQHIPEGCPTARLIGDVVRWCAETDDWRLVRGRIIRHWGHPDCTNMYQNIGVTLMALLLGNGDLIETTMMALNCGFDTDCTCATAGSIIGILKGAQWFHDQGFRDQGYILGVEAPRRSDRVCDLAEDTCAMGLHFAQHLNDSVVFLNAPEPPQIALPPYPELEIEAEYVDMPAIAPGDDRRVALVFRSHSAEPLHVEAAWTLPEHWSADVQAITFNLAPGQTYRVACVLHMDENIPIVWETNHIQVTAAVGERTYTYRFGLAGAAVWTVYGPFWSNVVDMPELGIHDKYYAHLRTEDETRQYHLNTCVHLDREYMTLEEILHGTDAGSDAAREPQRVFTYEDKFTVEQLVGFQGPCTVYAVRRLISPETRPVRFLVGHTDAYRLWINGELVSHSDQVDWWTAENKHLPEITLRQGENTVAVQLIRRSGTAAFSLIPTTKGTCTDQYADFGSVM